MSEIGSAIKEVLPKKCDIRLTEGDMRMLKQLADDIGCTKSDIMRMALRNLFKQRQG